MQDGRSLDSRGILRRDDLGRALGVRVVIVHVEATTVAIDDEGETDPERLRQALPDDGYPPEPA
jgi:hypothetical protein